MVEYVYDTWGKKVTTTGSLAGTLGLFQPFRYRGYVYDWETGFYYLQSRYYDPTTGRFISADILLSTGQGVLGYNCYAYCLDNPVNRLDVNGCNSAIDLLLTWLFGDGSDQKYEDCSDLVRALRRSKKMKGFINEAIDESKKGFLDGHEIHENQSAIFTREEDGSELYLALHKFSYTITVTKEIKVTKFLWWTFKKHRYKADVTVTDTYNFDKIQEWDSFGNVMNNLAYLYHEKLGGGKDYDIEATYTVYTKWKRGD